MTLPLLLDPTALLPRVDDQALLIIDVCSEERYRRGHLPGAVHVHPGHLQCGIEPATGRLPELAALSELFSSLGLTTDRHVIATDDEGGGWAGRLLWTLDCIGHAHYSLLDGGTVAWSAEGLPMSTEQPPARSSTYQARLSEPAPIVTLADLLSELGSPGLGIWDARSPEEYAGSKVLAQRGGHIPGAVNLEWTELMDPSRQLRLKPLATIQTMLSERGLTPDKHIVTHCQSHHRSGLSYIVAKLLGYPRIDAYDGSWSEWGNCADTPISTS